MADQFGILEEDRKNFYITSGLRFIRNVDHPLPAIRLDAVIYIMEVFIKDLESVSSADEVYDEIIQYVWEVDYLNCNKKFNGIYLLIAYTPTAQDFIKEVDRLWQKQRINFKSYIDQSVKLFYVNRIIHMTDEGEFVIEKDECS